MRSPTRGHSPPPARYRRARRSRSRRCPPRRRCTSSAKAALGIAAHDPAADEHVAGPVRVEAAARRRSSASDDRREGGERLPGDRKARKVEALDRRRFAHDGRHRLAAKAHLALGQHRLVGKAGQMPKPLRPGTSRAVSTRRMPGCSAHEGVEVAERERRARACGERIDPQPQARRPGRSSAPNSSRARRPWRRRRGAAARAPTAAPAAGAARRHAAARQASAIAATILR